MFKVADEPTILKFKVPGENLIMEWHRLSKKLFLIVLDESMTKGHGVLIGEDVQDHGTAINLSNMWNRGYQFAKREGYLRKADNATKQRANEGGILAVAEPD